MTRHPVAPDDRVRAHLWVTGRVQGVWFRASTAERAQALGLHGWVRNLPDGRVEAVAEGAEAAVEALVAFCREGPPLARVDDLRVTREPVEDEPPFYVAR